LYSMLVWRLLNGKLWNRLLIFLDLLKLLLIPFNIPHHYYWFREPFNIGNYLVSYYVQLLIHFTLSLPLSLKKLSSLPFSSKPFKISTALSLTVRIRAVLKSSLAFFIAVLMRLKKPKRELW